MMLPRQPTACGPCPRDADAGNAAIRPQGCAVHGAYRSPGSDSAPVAMPFKNIQMPERPSGRGLWLVRRLADNPALRAAAAGAKDG